MKLCLALAATLLGIVGSAPLRAADVAKIDCVRDRLPAETLDSMAAGAVLLFSHKPGGEPRQADIENLFAAAQSCQKTYGWSRESRDIAAYYTQATVLLSAARSMLRDVGYDADTLEVSFRALPPDLIKSMASGKASEEAAAAILSIMTKQGVAYSQERLERAVYFASELVEVDRQRAAFASS